MSSLSLVVVETESGAEVRVRGSEEPGEHYASLREALDSLLTDAEFAPKAGILRDESGAQIGVWRWLDASAEEPAPAEDGSQVTRDLIARMAARLNGGSPAPMDGGTSEAHAQLSATSTPADGYAHVGVEVRDASGRWHLFLYCELAPSTARDVDAGRLAYGSIGFTTDGRLLQHALTNVPAVEGLRPNNSVRGAPRGVRVHFRSMRITMAQTPTVAKRATLADVEQLLLEMTGAKPEELGTALVEIVAAHKAEMSEEAAPEAPPEGEQAAGADATQRSDAPMGTPAPDAEPRADAAFPDAASAEMFAAESLGLLRDVFGKPDASPAELLDLAKASLAAFKGAIGQAAPPADAGQMSESADQAARSVSDAHKRALDENARLKSEIAKRDMRDTIAKRASEAKAALTDAELADVVTDALATQDADARERCIQRALRAAQVVPSGRVFGGGATGATSARTLTEAAEQLLPEVAKSHPNKPPHVLISIAQRTARERFPHLSA